MNNPAQTKFDEALAGLTQAIAELKPIMGTLATNTEAVTANLTEASDALRRLMVQWHDADGTAGFKWFDTFCHFTSSNGFEQTKPSRNTTGRRPIGSEVAGFRTTGHALDKLNRSGVNHLDAIPEAPKPQAPEPKNFGMSLPKASRDGY